ncbi:hypothetical protein LNTAR_10221 [Lentisphaera araneosa HTCC2155]|uniref:Uncharacterized protein n=1 Tax=Lentisphaera araneosa HTCC2155 TaxID=313628 RepID=A6DIJ7_9BACT|nr:HEPN domain-containing protein [Lentisphaera araneosa]EDM28283.1 hypothetical protein LNTAR_10221 [Lentisphaera araneosa HTCC2155]
MDRAIEKCRSDWEEVCADYEIEENLRIRLHRCFSWAARIEPHQGNDSLDEAFLSAWLAFNSLFARIDANTNQFLPEKESMTEFLQQVLRIDRQNKIKQFLGESKWQMEQLLQCKFLQQSFWRDLGEDQSSSTFKDSFSFFRRKGEDVVLKQVLLRIYLMRNQLVHGGATYGSKMNRHTLMLCLFVLQPFLNCIIDILVHEGSDVNLGSLPYPPVR